MTPTEAKAQFIAWLRTNYPEAYAIGFSQSAPSQGVSGFWDSFDAAVSNITQALPDLAKTYVDYQNAQNLIELNAKRAQQGMSPLTLNAQGQLVTAGGLPVTQNDMRLASGSISNTTLLIGGGVALLLIVLLLNR